VAEESELVCVRHAQGIDLAQIYRSKLEAMDIPVLLEYESAGLVFGITVDGLGEVRIMVPETYAAEAEALLADVADDDLDAHDQGFDADTEGLDQVDSPADQ
jgi:hypothetical protein